MYISFEPEFFEQTSLINKMAVRDIPTLSEYTYVHISQKKTRFTFQGDPRIQKMFLTK